MPGTHAFGIRAFGVNFRVATTCLETHATLDRYIFPSLPRMNDPKMECGTEFPDVFVSVARVAGQLELLVDGVAVESGRDVIDLVPALVRVLDDAVIQRLNGLRAVHAGVVLWGGRALLLPGVTHAGKSSLVAELLRRGATYFSDEYALIDSDGRVHPYARTLLLRNGLPDQVPVLARECDASTGDAPAPVGLVLFLEYQPGGAWSIAKIPQSEALLALLRNTPHALSESPDLVQVFQRAVAGAACYAGNRGDAVDAAGHLWRLCGEPS